MRRVLLDTTFLIDVEREAAALDAAVADEDDVAIAAITVAELRVGVELARGRARAAREVFVDDILEVVPVVAYDRGVAEVHARLLAEVRRKGRPRGAHDLQIAATAAATGRTLVTADVDAFADLPGVDVARHR